MAFVGTQKSYVIIMGRPMPKLRGGNMKQFLKIHSSNLWVVFPSMRGPSRSVAAPNNTLLIYDTHHAPSSSPILGPTTKKGQLLRE
jgi:hypothetical protein